MYKLKDEKLNCGKVHGPSTDHSPQFRWQLGLESREFERLRKIGSIIGFVKFKIEHLKLWYGIEVCPERNRAF